MADETGSESRFELRSHFGEILRGHVEANAAEIAPVTRSSLLTDHDLLPYELLTEHAAYVLDTRNRVSGPQIEHL